ncbi:hypothetical protein, partial [Escherichia coli]|uniref:hypothetical protein n=1 Tax=Escherichia coli TaxID=562 RepID=UPI000BE15FD5
SLKTSIKTITYLSDIGCLEIQGASLINDTQRCAEGYELSDGIVYRDEINEVRRKYRFNTTQ